MVSTITGLWCGIWYKSFGVLGFEVISGFWCYARQLVGEGDVDCLLGTPPLLDRVLHLQPGINLIELELKFD